MQTDTVVGIVGAVVLVSVMVGVFAYEYNNTGDDGVDDGDGGDQSLFEQQYPGLAADGDVDGDGTPNVDDDDLDGDGTLNQNDTETAVSFQVDGTVAQSAGTPQSDTQTFALEEGARALELQLTYDRPAGLPGQVGQQPKLNFVLTDPNGERYDYQEQLGGAGDASVTVTWALGGDLPAGEWTLTATSSSLAAPAMSYAGEATVGYGTA